jgi:hypothetical protein
MDVVHALDRVLFVFSDFGISVIKLFLHLPFVFNSGIFENLEGSRHVLHLGLKGGEIFVFSVMLFDHFF